MLEVQDVSVAYDGVAVLRGVSHLVAPGEIVALVGENGCGKSSLGRVMSASQLVDDGRVVVDGHDPAVSELERLRVRALVGRLGQDPSDQIVSSLVYDEVAFGPRNLGLDDAAVASRVREALALVGMSSFEQRLTTELSGGEQQRIALAGVLAMQPEYLVLDEPTAQLDSHARALMRELFDQLAHARGLGIVLITHDSFEIELADRVIHLQGEGVGSDFSERDVASGVASPHTAKCGPKRCEGADSVVGPVPEPSAASLLEPVERAVHEPVAGSAHELVTEPVAGPAREPLSDSTHEPVADPTREPPADPAPCNVAETAPGTAALELRHVSFSHDNKSVLKDVSFTLRAGDVAVLRGASGAGKSTLASIAAGLCDPDAGEVFVAGAPTSPASVGLAFQNPESQFFLDTVFDEIAYAPRNAGLTGSVLEAAVQRAVDLVGLDAGLLNRFPFELSGGQARRVALASVVSLDAPAYIFDEPTAALDERGRAFACGLVRALAQEGKAILVITHDIEEWTRVATRELVLADGHVSEVGVPDSAASSVGDRDGLISAIAGNNGRNPATRSKRGSRTLLKPFGGYVADTPLARIDARVKVTLLFAATAGVFMSAGLPSLIPWFIVLAACLHAAGLRVQSVARGMRPVAIVLAFTLLANMISCDGSADLVLAGAVGISELGMQRGLMAVARILLLVGFSLCVASSTTGTQISDAAIRLMRPLARLGVPVAPLGMVLSLALRFIPLVSEELGRIRLAQRARGARFDEGTLVQRIGVWSSVLTPLMIGLFRRADRLADAMAARCYDASAAGRLPSPRPLAMQDRWALAIGFACIILCVLL
ncbi:MAG: ATP-binding cassette domain-containing protein [Coriobacteriaceae bacterium]|nr:ATP-binding cassette domain-containing protein [Coriobacteriaceae bacterium]